MKIEIIKCLEDNFSYLLINEKNSDACVVDPGEAKPVLKFIEENKINLIPSLLTIKEVRNICVTPAIKLTASSISAKSATLLIELSIASSNIIAEVIQ